MIEIDPDYDTYYELLVPASMYPVRNYDLNDKHFEKYTLT